jgi:hypothetical protein
VAGRVAMTLSCAYPRRPRAAKRHGCGANIRLGGSFGQAPLGAGLISVAGTQVNVDYELAGQRVRLRMDGTQLAVISHDGQLVRTLSCPVPAADRNRLRGARRARPMPP